MNEPFFEIDKVSHKLSQLQVDKTCLSPKVYNILCKAGLDIKDLSQSCLLDEIGLISWSELSKSLPAYTGDSYDYFLSCASALAPVFQASETCLKPMSEDVFLKKFSTLFLWTSSPKVLEKSFSILKEDRDTSTNLALLLMLPVLERSLGDVFLLKGKQCPSMIKDLLVTKELEQIFGKSVIELLRIVLGPPISLNLRNVTWHGFPQPGELPTRYGYFMLLVIASLGKVLQNQGSSQIPHRTFISFPQMQQLAGIFPEIGEEEFCVIEELVSESPFVLPPMEPLLRRAVDSFKEARHGDCIVLLLPQLEHGLRRLFALANHCPERVLTAENTVLFTTFDEILSPHMDDNGTAMNKLRYLTGPSYISLLMDMLTYPEGPRLRDRFSHGETSFESNHKQYKSELGAIASHVLSVVASFCILCLDKKSKLHDTTYVNKVERVGKNYTSVFHPVALFKSQLKRLCPELNECHGIQRPDELDIGTTVQWEDYQKDSDFQNSNVYKTGKHMIASLGNTFPKDILSILLPFHNVDEFAEEYVDVEVETLYRNVGCDNNKGTNPVSYQTSQTLGVNSKEDEVIGLLRKIVSECVKVLRQSKASLLSKYKQWVEKTLRSRQRDTYRRMLDLFPYILCGLRQTLLVLVLYLHILMQNNQELLARHVKFLKSVLQYCENLVSFTSPEKNRWEEAQKYTDELMKAGLKI